MCESKVLFWRLMSGYICESRLMVLFQQDFDSLGVCAWGGGGGGWDREGGLG